jgi:hypothetical protein
MNFTPITLPLYSEELSAELPGNSLNIYRGFLKQGFGTATYPLIHKRHHHNKGLY